MDTKSANTLIATSERGLSLVELLVSIAIGVAVLAGSIQVVVSSNRAFLDQSEVRFIQTNARFAVNLISRDLRMAGYLGCATEESIHLTNTVSDDGNGFVSLEGIQGFDGTDMSTFPADYRDKVKAGTDSILIRYASTNKEMNVRFHNAALSTLMIWGTHDYEAGSTLLVTDANCRAAGLFHVSSGVGSSSIVHGPTHNSCSTSIKNAESFDCRLGCMSGLCGLPGSYNSGSKVMPLVSHGYFIAPSGVADGVSSLKRQVLSSNGVPSTATEEIALGVEDMKIVYGYDSIGDGSVDQYRTANTIKNTADWNKVISVRLSLVFRSSDPFWDQAQEKTLVGTRYNDRYMRQLVTTTVRIRNRG